MKKCARCHVKKTIKYFGNHHAVCKKCCAKQVRCYYKQTASYRKTCLDRKKQLREQNQFWVLNYLKEHPCVVCGETDPLVLQFDHVKKKYLPVMSLTSNLKTLMKEIAKCEVVCANDHARRTAQRANTIRWRLALGESNTLKEAS